MFLNVLIISCKIVNCQIEKRQCPYKPGSVPLSEWRPIIYLLRMSPCVSSILPSIVEQAHRAGHPVMTMVYLNLQPPADTAHLSPSAWWSLTPPSHPYLMNKREAYHCGGCFLLPCANRHRLLVFSQVEHPMLPGLSSRACFITSDKTRALPLLFEG